MKKSLFLGPLVLVTAVMAAACDYQKSESPLQPSAPPAAIEAAPVIETPKIEYPHSGPDVIAYVAAKYPERLAGGISRDERIRNMEFLRDRVIEIGKCGGLGLGWNLKRGGPEVSIDFITERLADGSVIGHDIAFDYDNASRALLLYWGDGSSPFYKEFTGGTCE